MKRALALIISCLSLLSTLAYAEMYKCQDENGRTEFKDKPCINEKQEVLNIKSTPVSSSKSSTLVAMGTKAFSDETIRYYNNLKTCSPYTFSFESFVGNGQNEIVGRKNDRCHVIVTTGDYTFNCNFSNKTIASLTSAQKYQEARENIFSTGPNLSECK